MNKIKTLIWVTIGLTLTITILSCTQNAKEKDYTNRDHYEVFVGRQFEIYYSTNSCCRYCVLNADDLPIVKLVDEKVMKDYPEGCEGCNRTSAFVFEAVAEGMDTIYLNMREASASCYELAGEPEKYVVTVKTK